MAQKNDGKKGRIKMAQKKSSKKMAQKKGPKKIVVKKNPKKIKNVEQFDFWCFFLVFY